MGKIGSLLLFCVVMLSLDSVNAECGKSDAEARRECRKVIEDTRLKRGGVLYQEYVDAMHTRRYRKEFTPAQWKTILLQKRVRIPLSAEEHRSLEALFIGE